MIAAWAELILTLILVTELDNKLEDLEEDEEIASGQATPKPEQSEEIADDAAMDASFMSESIYQKLPLSKARKHHHRTSSKIVCYSNVRQIFILTY